MGRFSQTELMAAHQQAELNTIRLNADNKKKAEVVVLEPVDPNREPLGWVEEGVDPFGGNDNNRRVAERIAASAIEASVPAAPVSPQAAAAADLAAAKAYAESLGIKEPEVPLVDDEGNPTEAGKAFELELKAAAALQAANAPATPPAAPVPPVAAPAWKAKA